MQTLDRHILLAEDESNMRRSITLLLKRAGCKTTTVKNGEEVLAAIKSCAHRSEPIDLVLCDLSLPGMSGIDVANGLRKIGINIPFLVMTGFIDRETGEELEKHGLHHVIFKPFDIKELIDKVVGVLALQSCEVAERC